MRIISVSNGTCCRPSDTGASTNLYYPNCIILLFFLPKLLSITITSFPPRHVVQFLLQLLAESMRVKLLMSFCIFSIFLFIKENIHHLKQCLTNSLMSFSQLFNSNFLVTSLSLSVMLLYLF